MGTPADGFGNTFQLRAPLTYSAAAIERGRLTVGFIGGSITAAKTGTRWPEPFAAWLADAHPGLELVIENAAIGATGSDLAVFRAQRDILSRQCDLVFVEFSVNDADQPTSRRMRSREGLLRQLLAVPGDVVIVHTFRPEMLEDMRAGRVPASIAEFEQLAEHYRLSSVWMGLHAWREVEQGLMKWEEWLPDGLHPEQRGSLSYAQSVTAFCTAALAAPNRSRGLARSLPPLFDRGAWERVGFVPFSAVHRTGPWMIRRWVADAFIDQVLQCTAEGAKLRFTFAGRGLVLGFDFGHASGEVRYRLDGGEWVQTLRPRFAWHGESGWYRPTVVADDLATGTHSFELETLAVTNAGRTSATTTIAFFGVIQ